MDDEILRRDLLTGFDYSYRYDDWVNPLSEALEGVTMTEALWKPAPNVKCIWEIVLHMAVWTENIVERMRGDRKARPAQGAWPPLPEFVEDPAWVDAQSRLWRSLDVFREAIQSVSFEVLREDGSVLADIFCRFTHNAYHIGQITKMRECIPSAQVQ